MIPGSGGSPPGSDEQAVGGAAGTSTGDRPSAIQAFIPQLALQIPSISLGNWPTPVGKLGWLSSELGAELWLKQDGLSASHYGGNKVRKLELLLGRSVESCVQRILTVGGIGSNHVVATAVYARRLGIKTSAVVTPQPITAAVRRNVSMLQALGTELWPAAHRGALPLRLLSLRAKYPRAQWIGPGGSTPLGTLGCVAAGLELASQIRDGALPKPGSIAIPLGSGGTTAGLALGLGLAKLDCRILAVRVVELPLCNRLLLGSLMARTSALMARCGIRPTKPARVDIEGGHLGRGYGHPTPEGTRACQWAKDHEGLHLEPTYTGKTLAGLIESRHKVTGPLLFWNTHSAQAHDIPSDLSDPRPLPPEISRWMGIRLP